MAADSPPDEDKNGRRRRTFIRLLVGLAIGIPILVELLTFLGLIEQSLFGDGEDGDGGTATPTLERVGVGDDLLPEAPMTATVTEAVVRANGTWRLTLTVDATNGYDVPAELRLDTVALEDGRTVDGGGSTGRLDPGGATTTTGRWELPQGTTPRTVRVVTVRFPPDGSAEATTRRVRLANVPVQGR